MVIFKNGLFYLKNFIIIGVFLLSLAFFLGSDGVGIAYATSSGNVGLYVESNNTVYIGSPLNVSYNFSIGEPYVLDLNVSSNFPPNKSSWKYSLYDIKHDKVSSSGFFTPNTTIVANRWANILTVSAKDNGESLRSSQVVFYVNVPNSEPVFGPIDNNIYVCEGEKLNYDFNASDIDEESVAGDISPKNPFFLQSLGMNGLDTSLFRIVSGKLSKANLGLSKGFVSKRYPETISVVDGSKNSNSVGVNITVIEVNNAPVMEDLGAQTVYSQGENSTFYHQMNVQDVEDGNSSDGNMKFNLSFEGMANVFDINSSTGVMNYTPSSEDLGKVFNLRVCVSDNPMNEVYDNFSICSAKGYVSDSISVCDNFSLTVTDDNRAPEILSYTPLENVSMDGIGSTLFGVNVSDADGTIPDIDWYVDGVLVEHNDGKSSDNFSYSPGCGVNGNHNISAVVTDGLANVSRNWNVDVSLVACVSPDSGSGSGGGGGGSSMALCREKWVCDDWNVCQSVKKSFDSGIFSFDDYSNYLEICAQNNVDKSLCGFQLRSCFDINSCNNKKIDVLAPEESQACRYVENPSCDDGVRNCHDGSCEVLIDCGGPCSSCPTCSDSIQNQGEDGVDCGGPCPYRCEEQSPSRIISFMLAALFILLVLVILIIIYELFNIVKYKNTERRKRLQRILGGGYHSKI